MYQLIADIWLRPPVLTLSFDLSSRPQRCLALWASCPWVTWMLLRVYMANLTRTGHFAISWPDNVDHTSWTANGIHRRTKAAWVNQLQVKLVFNGVRRPLQTILTKFFQLALVTDRLLFAPALVFFLAQVGLMHVINVFSLLPRPPMHELYCSPPGL